MHEYGLRKQHLLHGASRWRLISQIPPHREPADMAYKTRSDSFLMAMKRLQDSLDEVKRLRVTK
jgi:hypothetical protein